MNRNEAITALVNYALEKELIEQEEKYGQQTGS